MESNISDIFREFDVPGKMIFSEPIKTGHINQTYFIRTDTGTEYVLQRINHRVFRDPTAVVRNKIEVSAHIAARHQGLPDEQLVRRVLRFYRTRSGDHLLKDEEGNFWNLLHYIHDSRVYLKTPNAKVAREAGKAVGGFLRDSEGLDPDSLAITIPRFHSMSLRFLQFDEALENAGADRIEQARPQIEFAEQVREEMQSLEARVDRGEVPVRVTHNDTKISNVLFSEEDDALCLIDLDTVMPGVVHFDFGDAVRTICNQGDEDESEVANVGFDVEYFEAFAKGFFGESGLELSDGELDGIASSPRVMTFIVGLRMLTDFLNNDVYFDTAYETHNLVRARAQFRLVELIGEHLDELQKIVDRSR